MPRLFGVLGRKNRGAKLGLTLAGRAEDFRGEGVSLAGLDLEPILPRAERTKRPDLSG
jgi:hypothetical protein